MASIYPKGVITVKLLENNKIIQRKILMAMARELNKRFRRSQARLLAAIQKLTQDLISEQPEIQELDRGILQGAFGLRRGSQSRAINSIVSAVAGSVSIEIREVVQAGSKVLKGGMFIYIQPSDFANLLSLPRGVVETEKGDSIPWLSWLLTAGDKILVGEIDVRYRKGTGRSGLATMGKPGVFRVPPAYSGVEDDNFITRAFVDSGSRLTELIRRNVR